MAWLNGSDHSYHNWIQGENGPVISDKPVAYALAVSGDYKTTYTIATSWTCPAVCSPPHGRTAPPRRSIWPTWRSPALTPTSVVSRL
ncbi:MAG: hypothetical protein ACLUIX_01480 [Oscillospiraceae bacterium]